MDYYLVEKYGPELEFEYTANIVALTPLVSHELDKRGITYNILEDFYDEREFIKEEDAYFRDQLIWFDKFDSFLFEIFPYAKCKHIKLATSYYYYIKIMVDSIILRCRIIDKFINKAKPETIIYVSKNWQEDFSNISDEFPLLFSKKNQSLFSRVVPMFCKKYGIAFQRIVLNETYKVTKTIYSPQEKFNIKIKNYLKSTKIGSALWMFHKTLTIDSIFPKIFEDVKCKLLFFRATGYNILDIVKELKTVGHRIFYKKGDDIIEFSFRHKLVGNISQDIDSNLVQNIENFIQQLSKTDIISWINNYCRIDVSSIVLPRLEYFMNNYCQVVISLIDKYIKFYDDNQIDIVFTPYMLTFDEHAAIIATRYSRKTKSACLQHGDAAYGVKLWDLLEYSPYDIYFTTNYEMEEYIKYRIQLGNFKTSVFQYHNRYKMLPKLNSIKKKISNNTTKKTVVYVPTFYRWDCAAWHEVRFLDTWYIPGKTRR